MSSTRLPGKVLMDMPAGSGVPVLARILDRLRLAAGLDEIVVATSVGAEDDPVAAIAESCGVAAYRGPLDDVLGRFVGAVDTFGFDTVVRITADCPCVDAAVVDAALALHAEQHADFTSNVLPRSYPHGLDVEVVRASVLREIDALDLSQADREHVMTYIYRTAPERFAIANLVAPAALTDPRVRVTLDTPADYEVISGIYAELGPEFDTAQMLACIARRPDLRVEDA